MERLEQPAAMLERLEQPAAVLELVQAQLAAVLEQVQEQERPEGMPRPLALGLPQLGPLQGLALGLPQLTHGLEHH